MKLSPILEARYHGTADWYVCPECEGEGGYYIKHGPDDYDAEMCEMCSGKGRLKRRDVEYLTKHDIYQHNEFKPIFEARYLGPNIIKVVGELFYDDRNLDQYHHEKNVVIRVKVHDFDANPGEENATVIEAKKVGGGESWLAEQLHLVGSEASYINDKYGPFVSGWGDDGPWALEKPTYW